MSKKRLLLLIGAVFLAAAASRCVFTVDETEYVLETEFGRVAATHGEGDAGLHFRPPWRSALRVDRRLQMFEPPTREMITGDKKNLEVASYVVWRVADPVRFVASSGTLGAAEQRLDERAAAALSNAIGQRDLAALASTDPGAWGLDALCAEAMESLAAGARRDLGVEVLDVRLRRFNHPVEVRPAVFDLIRSERRRVADSLRAEGEAEYQTLISQAERKRDTILAEAEAEAERVRGQAEAESIRLANEAQARDPKFAEFLRTLETYRAILDDKATVVLSSTSPLLHLLTHGPGEDLAEPPLAPSEEARP